MYWTERFGNDHPIEIEVGSGKGHFITTLAEQNPDKNYVALELQTTAAGIILRTKLEKGLDNLQILRGDAADINCFFPANSTKDRKSTRMNSSHVSISYAVFCLKIKKKK